MKRNGEINDVLTIIINTVKDNKIFIMFHVIAAAAALTVTQYSVGLTEWIK